MVLFKASDGSGLVKSIGEYGRQVDARPKRTKDQKEAYCVRRYLLSLANCGLLSYPLAVEKCETPDFIVTGTESFGIEVTEATDEVDQQEYTKAAKSGVTMWSDGQFGGRGTFVGVSHERLWLSYVRKAIQKKQNIPYCSQKTKLLIYSNSNAGGHIADGRAFELLNAAEFSSGYPPLVEVSILRSTCLLFDVGGSNSQILHIGA